MGEYFRTYSVIPGKDMFLGKICTFLADRPGSLADLASIFAQFSINIVFFHYNRTEHPNRVLLEVTSASLDPLNRVKAELREKKLPGVEDLTTDRFELGIIDTGNILKIEVRLQNTPGTLGAFSHLLAKHDANVIHMSYNEDVSETSATISLVTQKPEMIDSVLKALNQHGYYYSVVYRGASHKEVDDIIGLNLAERFFFSLKRLLGTDDIARLKKLVNSSKLLTDSLINFSKEAGRHFEEGSIITKVLAFASASLMKTGKRFFYHRLEPLTLNGLTLHVFRVPTGGNISILECENALIMIDTGYGLYYEDVKTMLRENGLDPARIQTIYLTHADADHAGMSGYFQNEFQCTVFLHQNASGILQHENRAWGSTTPLFHLNHYFTVLVNEFTDSRFPQEWKPYGQKTISHQHEFPLVEVFDFAGHTFYILESLGGHIPGQVFIFGADTGLFFTADYLLHVESLYPEEKELLTYPKFMMQSTNVNSVMFRKEMEMMKEFMQEFNTKMFSRNRESVIVPGHGDYYRFTDMIS